MKPYKFISLDEIQNGIGKETTIPIVSHYSDGVIKRYQCKLCMKQIFHNDNYCRGCGAKIIWENKDEQYGREDSAL